MPQLLLELLSEEIPARMQPGAQRDLERLHIQPIASKHTTMISPARICGGAAATRVGAVDHIIVNQSRAVEQLDHCRQLDRATTVGAAPRRVAVAKQ